MWLGPGGLTDFFFLLGMAVGQSTPTSTGASQAKVQSADVMMMKMTA